MSGRVPPSSRAGQSVASLRTQNRSVQKAALLTERFTGHPAQSLGVVNMPSIPSTMAVIGELDGVLYTTTRDGRQESYKHDFAPGDKALLCVSPDGRQLWIVGGRYDFTEKGIVDASDTKNSPRKRR